MSEKTGLPKPPLFTADYIAMAEILQFAMERFGQLILALMYYTADGTEPKDLPPDIGMMFEVYRRKVDAAREKYEQKSATNAKNGAKGGLAKAENAKKRDAANFKPPTKKQFQKAVEHFVDKDEIDEVESYEVDAFYDALKEIGWTINGEPLQSRSDWETVIQARFYTAFAEMSCPCSYYSVFKEIFSKFHGLRDAQGKSDADTATYDFFDTYDEKTQLWNVHGEEFPAAKWEEALARFMEGCSESSKR